MKKFTNILLSAVAVTMIGCGSGGTDPQGAIGSGLPNDGMLKIPQHNQGQEAQNQQVTIDGIWYLFYNKTQDGRIDIRNYNEILRLDTQGQLYSVDNNQESRIGTYRSAGASKIELVGNNGAVNAIEFVDVANEEGNCFYTKRFLGNGSQDELWCKKPGSSSTQTSSGMGTGTDARPQLLQPTGYEVDLKEYLYPDHTIRVGGTTSENVHNYVKNQDGSLVYNGKVKKTYKKVLDPQRNVIIQEFLNNSIQPKREDIIYRDRIDSYSGLSAEPYNRKVQKNSLVSEFSADGIQLRCVVKDIIGGTEDLSSEIPSAIQNHLKAQVTGASFKDNQFTYMGVVHIRCGTTTGETIDSYNVNGWGEVLSIYNYTDNTTRYEILDKYSIQHQ